MLSGLFAQAPYVVIIRFGFQESVVNQTRPIPGRTRFPERQSDASRARINYPVHPLRAAIETLVRAAAHGGLLLAVAVKARDDYVRYLLNEVFKIAVI
jgi:hypothetical protein